MFQVLTACIGDIVHCRYAVYNYINVIRYHSFVVGIFCDEMLLLSGLLRHEKIVNFYPSD